ncbi:tryptophan 7-halogenase [Sphingomonas sp. PR090111-T3T-6A]|uniref:tryptophan 7-halogenase n=1 Tax=Sphingomonas sp. PR090111-T3T-6A TaxID=685778 RepID=UPI00036CF649|nr:tryptophan 7-halogenase [Sphingomonas sp. PR090111-T3T-6A]
MSAIDRVVVAGRDAPLWLAAATIRQALAPAGVAVCAVELPGRAGAADCHATQPALEALHSRLGIDEATLLRLTSGAFSLGQNVVDTTGAMPPFMIPFGSFGTRIDGQDFFAYWLKARSLGLNVALEHFSLTAAAARQGRILFPDDSTEAYGRSDYGYHLPAIPYARCLKALAVHLGVEALEARSVAAERGKEGIAALLLDDGRRVEGLLFIDAGSGLSGGRPRESWRESFPVDRLLTATAPRFSSVPAYAEIRLGESGWTLLHPAAGRTHLLHAWSSAHHGDEAAVRDAGALGGLSLEGIDIRAVDPGCLAEPWEGNCIAVGEAARVADPIHDIGLHVVQLGLVHLLACFPASTGFAALRAEYNRVMRSALGRVRDFQSAFYIASQLSSPFWAEARGARRSPELDHLIATFLARGEIAPFEDESFAPDSWRALLIGQGVSPVSWLPPIDRTAPEAIKAQFRAMLGFVRDQVLRQPTHDALLDRIARDGPHRTATAHQ